jgi:MFS transporter, DHA1 family, inner membrane transport protein
MIHYGVHAFAEAGGGAFVFVYLLRAGVSVPAALTVEAILLAGRFVLRPMVLPFARRYGLRASLMLGSAIGVFSYPLLPAVHGLGAPLAAFVFVSSLSGVFYWTSFHAYFALVGDAHQRGRQIAIREAIATTLGVVAPLLGGWSLVTLGPGPTFWAVGVIQALSCAPLIGAPNFPVLPQAPGAFAAARQGLFLFLFDGALAAGFNYVWQIALFVSLGESFLAYGGAVALASLVATILGLLLGHSIDAGHGRKAVVAAYGVAILVIVFRAASLGSPWLAVTANAAGAFVYALVIPTEMTAVYNMAKTSPCALRFHIVTEGAWDVGCSSGCLLAAGLVALGLPLAAGVLTASAAAAASMLLLLRYYATNPVASLAAAD